MISTEWISGTPCLRSDGQYAQWIFFLLPGDDEANRLRRTAVEMMRHLTGLGYGCALPDLSPYGENSILLSDLEPFSVDNTLSKVAETVCPDPSARHLACFRAGARLAVSLPACSIWCLSPPPDYQGSTSRTVRLRSERAGADQWLEGPPVWRWAEPGSAPALTKALAQDLAQQVRQCAVF